MEKQQHSSGSETPVLPPVPRKPRNLGGGIPASRQDSVDSLDRCMSWFYPQLCDKYVNFSLLQCARALYRHCCDGQMSPVIYAYCYNNNSPLYCTFIDYFCSILDSTIFSLNLRMLSIHLKQHASSHHPIIVLRLFLLLPRSDTLIKAIFF